MNGEYNLKPFLLLVIITMIMAGSCGYAHGAEQMIGMVNSGYLAYSNLKLSVQSAVGSDSRSTFILTARSNQTPMPDGKKGGCKEISIEGNSSGHFGRILYKIPDVYEYRITRKADKSTINKREKLDTSEYMVRVIVYSKGRPSIEILKEGESGKLDEIIYTDSDDSRAYVPPNRPDTGDHSDLLLTLITLLSSIIALTLILQRIFRGRKRHEEKSNCRFFGIFRRSDSDRRPSKTREPSLRFDQGNPFHAGPECSG